VSFIVLNFVTKLLKSKETGFLSCLPHSNLIKAIYLQFLVLCAQLKEFTALWLVPFLHIIKKLKKLVYWC